MQAAKIFSLNLYFCSDFLFTKSSHFSFVAEEALKHDIHLETSYAYDIENSKKLYRKKKITKEFAVFMGGNSKDLKEVVFSIL